MKYLLLLFIALTITSCRMLTPSPHAIVSDPYLREKCFSAGSPGIFRVVHVIHATIRGKSSSFIGITIADVSTDRIRATLLSVEGLVLLDAVDKKGSITIYQAMHPFNSKIFARGLFDDIKFMFFPPQGNLIDAKVRADGSVTCTWMDQNRVFERHTVPSGKTIVSEYDSDHRVIRRVELSPPLVKGFYTHIRMDSYDSGGYSLSLGLLEGGPLDRLDGLFSP